MNKIKVTYFEKQKDRELYGVINILPFLLFLALFIVSYVNSTSELYINIGLIILLVTTLTSLNIKVFNNGHLVVTDKALTILKNKNANVINWNSINHIKFHKAHYYLFVRPIIMEVIGNDINYLILIDAYLNQTPKKKFGNLRELIPSKELDKIDFTLQKSNRDLRP